MTDNLSSLHQHEEQLRDESLAIIGNSETLTEHFQLVHGAMNLIYGYTHDHPHRNDDELTLQMLGIRLFNASAASVKLALSGYYQVAFAQLRDFVETYFLVDYFRMHKDKIAVWMSGQSATPKTLFPLHHPQRPGQTRRVHN